MCTWMENLIAERDKKAPLQKNYMELLRAIYDCGNIVDGALNENNDPEDVVKSLLSRIIDMDRYCIEEYYLHGRSVKDIADDFRDHHDEFMKELIDYSHEALLDITLEKIEDIFRNMDLCSLKDWYLDKMKEPKMPESGDKPNEYSRLIDIIWRSFKEMPDCNDSWFNKWHCKYITMRYWLKEPEDQIARYFYVNMEEYIEIILERALRNLSETARYDMLDM